MGNASKFCSTFACDPWTAFAYSGSLNRASRVGCQDEHRHKWSKLK
jgi:hypothetical protein